MKTCSKCGVEKDDVMFSRSSRARGYKITGTCRACNGARVAAWVKKNPDRRAAICAKYYIQNPGRFVAILPRQNTLRRQRVAANPEKYQEAARAWRAKNRERVRVAFAEWKLANRAHCNAEQIKRAAQCIQATPVWANTFFIEEAYGLAQRRAKMTGFEWHVDHIVPLKSKIVCGLHTEQNLQVIPAVVNKRKGNRFWPDMPRAPQHI